MGRQGSRRIDHRRAPLDHHPLPAARKVLPVAVPSTKTSASWGVTLRPVQAHSRQGAAVMLDQCDHCGGVWFDRFELFQVDEADAHSLDKVDKASLRFPRGSNEKPLCPHCREPLRVFSDPNIPANIQLLICDACEGFWVNHGDVAGHAEFRERGHKRLDGRQISEAANSQPRNHLQIPAIFR
ncbi:MAG: zf-TFIIB domain-containing protein [Thermoleophilia bacterium]